MLLSSVIKASHWFTADERIRQSMKSPSIPLSLKAVSKIVLSCGNHCYVLIVDDCSYASGYSFSSKGILSI